MGRPDWFELVAPDAFRAVWQPVLASVGLRSTATPSTTSKENRELIKASPRSFADRDHLVRLHGVRRRGVPTDDVALAVAPQHRSGTQRAVLAAPADAGCAFFVLGARHDGSALRYRIDTPWDFQRRYGHQCVRGRARVTWSAIGRWRRVTVTERDTGISAVVTGHVEVRWSHGKLNGSPEAKVYLELGSARGAGL